MAEATHIGRRVREVRALRGLTLEAAAGLAGLSAPYLSRIESGKRPVERRATLEALAHALQVAPSDLTGGPFLVKGTSAEHSAVAALRNVLADFEIGEPVDAPTPPWAQVVEQLDLFNALRPKADYAAIGEALPELVRDLHVSLDGRHERDALVGLVDCYSAAQAAAKNLGAPDLAQVAARHVRDATAKLSGPEWAGLAAWSRAQAISTTARQRARAVALQGADEISGELGDPRVADVYGSLHLTAALACVTAGEHEQAASHVNEAADIARRSDINTGFGHLSFGPGNVQIWRTMLEVEAGNGGKAVEIANAVDPTILPPSSTRRAAWLMDIGRGYATMPGKRDEAVNAIMTAEELAPQRVRSNAFAREAVTNMLVRAQKNAGGRNLRGLAYRMGLAS